MGRATAVPERFPGPYPRAKTSQQEELKGSIPFIAAAEKAGAWGTCEKRKEKRKGKNMRNLLQPTASGRTADQERVLLAVLANGGIWPRRFEPVEGSRRRRRKSPKPVSGGPRRMVLLNSKGKPFTRMQGLDSDAIASESAPAKRNGHAAAHTPATHDHPHRAAAHNPRGPASPQGSIVRHARRRKHR